MPDHSDEPNPSQSLDEFGIISRFFTDSAAYPKAWPSPGIGDDCAFLDVGAARIAVTADMMALGTHFLDDADPYTVGRKSLAVNLSDLAAAGAEPKAFFLSISLPRADARWLERYSAGLLEEAHRYGCPLRGGDTVKAPVIDGKPSKTTISICAMGELPAGLGLTRGGALPGDDIWVTGTPGDAFAALGQIWGYWECPDETFAYFKGRMDLPTPRVGFGRGLLTLAHAACDISDGLTGDLGHILDRSDVNAQLQWAQFPLSDAMAKMPEAVRRRCVLAGGDDYELLFVAPQSAREAIEALSRQTGVRATRIGRILKRTESSERLRILDAEGVPIEAPPSFNHFGGAS